MHELSVTESILEISLRHANNSNAKSITNIYLVIGQLASIIDDSVQFYWDIISKGTLADRAVLNFRRIPTTLACLDCNNQYLPGKDSLDCPKCKGHHIKILSGEEFYIEAIDIET